MKQVIFSKDNRRLSSGSTVCPISDAVRFAHCAWLTFFLSAHTLLLFTSSKRFVIRRG